MAHLSLWSRLSLHFLKPEGSGSPTIMVQTTARPSCSCSELSVSFSESESVTNQLGFLWRDMCLIMHLHFTTLNSSLETLDARNLGLKATQHAEKANDLQVKLESLSPTYQFNRQVGKLDRQTQSRCGQSQANHRGFNRNWIYKLKTARQENQHRPGHMCSCGLHVKVQTFIY